MRTSIHIKINDGISESKLTYSTNIIKLFFKDFLKLCGFKLSLGYFHTIPLPTFQSLN